MIMLYRHYIIRGPYVMCEVEYLWKGGVKKDGVDVNLILYNWPNFKNPHSGIDFGFSPHLRTSSTILQSN